MKWFRLAGENDVGDEPRSSHPPSEGSGVRLELPLQILYSLSVQSVYTQRCQDRLHRITSEVTKRKFVYADFVMSASNLLLSAHIHDEIALGADEQLLVGLINRMRLFAPPDVIGEAESVLRAIVEISLKPSIEFRQLAKRALSNGLDPDRFCHSARFAGLIWTE